jgi:hypothetical protein
MSERALRVTRTETTCGKHIQGAHAATAHTRTSARTQKTQKQLTDAELRAHAQPGAAQRCERKGKK